LIPEFYNKKINLAVMLAPVVTLFNNPDPVVRLISKPSIIGEIISVAKKLNALNWLPYNFLSSDATVHFCKFFNAALCKAYIELIVDGDIKADYLER
jgi:hypothetical protein